MRIATIVWSGWANRSVNSPTTIRAWSAMVSSWSSVLIWSQRSASVPMTSGSVVPLQGIVMLVFARARLSQATKVCLAVACAGIVREVGLELGLGQAGDRGAVSGGPLAEPDSAVDVAPGAVDRCLARPAMLGTPA